MKKNLTLLAVLLFVVNSNAQIYEPEGLNMPGAWNGWTNPPTNALALANPNQVTNGKLTKVTTGVVRWKTTIKVAASGGDIVGGTYEFLFTSGPPAGAFNNKWSNVTVVMNTIQNYTYQHATNNSITLSNGKWYTMNWEDKGYINTTAIFMETSGFPITLTNVSDNYTVSGSAVTVNITTNTTPSSEEKIFVRYTTDNWSSSSFVQATGSGTAWTATIPADGVTGTVNNMYYVLTTTVSSPNHATADMITINYLNNGGDNYPLPVELTSFSAKQNGNNVTLIWKTATETNNFGFDVEKSADSKNWNKIGFVQGSGNSNAPKDYSYTDKISSLNGKFYYRLKQIDNDGTTSFSKVVEVESLKPATFGLSQNYPNPFNPSTVIRYQIPVDSRVSVKVYNVLGNVVTTLQNGFQTAGEYSVRVDGSNLASGVYFYKIEAGEFSATKKMLLTK